MGCLLRTGMLHENQKTLTADKYDSATTRARALKLSFISLISLSASSMNLSRALSRTHITRRGGTQLDNEIDNLVLEHGVRMVVGYQEGDVVALTRAKFKRAYRGTIQIMKRTLTGFLLRTMKLSARCIMNRVNLWHSIRSISSACLILMLMRTELTEGSMRTRSFSFREMVRGFKRTSFEVLQAFRVRCVVYGVSGTCSRTLPRPRVCCAVLQPGA